MSFPRLSHYYLVAIGVVLFCLLLVAICGYLAREVTRRRRAEKSLRQQTDRERLVGQIAQQIRQSLDLDEVLATTVAQVQRFLQADRVLIYRLWDDGTGSAIHETVLPPYSSILGQTFPEEVFPQEYHQAYSLGKTRTITNIEQADVESCLADFVKLFGVRAKLVVPIIQENRENAEANSQLRRPSNPYLWGLLIAHQCTHPRQWENWEVELMKQLATQVAIAIQQSELYNQLQQLNAQLEQRVQQRTAELATANASLRAEIAERQRTEIALRHTNHTLQALVTASPRAILMLDREGKVKIWNPAAERMFGWTEAEVIDRPNPIRLDDPLEDCTALQKHTSHDHNLQNCVLQGKTYAGVELRRTKKDGTVIDIVFSAAPLPDANGQISGIVAVIADITEHKQRAEQLRLLQSVVVNTNDAVIITEAGPIDEPGPRILYVNEAFTRITGYKPEEVLGKTPRILQGPKTDRAALDKVRAALWRWESITVEAINYRKDGSEFWNEFNLVPVANARGCYTHWIAVLRDTTARKRADEIRLALEREKELSALKTRFFSMASHEFRTPLSTALAAAQVLENSQVEWENTEKRMRNLHRIQDSVKNMVQLLDDILTINRAETGNLAFNPKPLNLEHYCRHFIEEMQLSAGEAHQLTFSCRGTTCSIALDEKLMGSILSNLLSNAIKYSPNGGAVSLELEFQADAVQIGVRDWGIGILPDDRQQLFEPFHRGKNIRTIPGTGLGLVVVKKCVELHQGTIRIASEAGAGTTCLVTLPLSRDSAKRFS
ncbi:MAG: PAS domain S-box protein [Oscillatoriaceae cyanobacterium Prado104]|jgi:PAS domain S-box-containing protein|nr:PAS domain S-box protein [Oscillatoriaceae cyanobacterium Prado104]